MTFKISNRDYIIVIINDLSNDKTLKDIVIF